MIRERKEKPAPSLIGIRADEVLPWQEAKRRLRIGQRTGVEAQRLGLQTVTLGKTKFVVGAEVVRFFGHLAEQQHQGGPTR